MELISIKFFLQKKQMDKIYERDMRNKKQCINPFIALSQDKYKSAASSKNDFQIHLREINAQINTNKIQLEKCEESEKKISEYIDQVKYDSEMENLDMRNKQESIGNEINEKLATIQKYIQIEMAQQKKTVLEKKSLKIKIIKKDDKKKDDKKEQKIKTEKEELLTEVSLTEFQILYAKNRIKKIAKQLKSIQNKIKEAENRKKSLQEAQKKKKTQIQQQTEQYEQQQDKLQKYLMMSDQINKDIKSLEELKRLIKNSGQIINKNKSSQSKKQLLEESQQSKKLIVDLKKKINEIKAQNQKNNRQKNQLLEKLSNFPYFSAEEFKQLSQNYKSNENNLSKYKKNVQKSKNDFLELLKTNNLRNYLNKQKKEIQNKIEEIKLKITERNATLTIFQELLKTRKIQNEEIAFLLKQCENNKNKYNIKEQSLNSLKNLLINQKNRLTLEIAREEKEQLSTEQKLNKRKNQLDSIMSMCEDVPNSIKIFYDELQKDTKQGSKYKIQAKLSDIRYFLIDAHQKQSVLLQRKTIIARLRQGIILRKQKLIQLKNNLEFKEKQINDHDQSLKKLQELKKINNQQISISTKNGQQKLKQIIQLQRNVKKVVEQLQKIAYEQKKYQSQLQGNAEKSIQIGDVIQNEDTQMTQLMNETQLLEDTNIQQSILKSTIDKLKVQKQNLKSKQQIQKNIVKLNMKIQELNKKLNQQQKFLKLQQQNYQNTITKLQVTNFQEKFNIKNSKEEQSRITQKLEQKNSQKKNIQSQIISTTINKNSMKDKVTQKRQSSYKINSEVRQLEFSIIKLANKKNALTQQLKSVQPNSKKELPKKQINRSTSNNTQFNNQILIQDKVSSVKELKLQIAELRLKKQQNSLNSSRREQESAKSLIQLQKLQNQLLNEIYYTKTEAKKLKQKSKILTEEIRHKTTQQQKWKDLVLRLKKLL